MTELTEDDIFNIVENAFSITIDALHDRMPKNSMLYDALVSASVDAIGFAVGIMLINNAADKDTVFDKISYDIKKSADNSFEKMKHLYSIKWE